METYYKLSKQYLCQFCRWYRPNIFKSFMQNTDNFNAFIHFSCLFLRPPCRLYTDVSQEKDLDKRANKNTSQVLIIKLLLSVKKTCVHHLIWFKEKNVHSVRIPPPPFRPIICADHKPRRPHANSPWFNDDTMG